MSCSGVDVEAHDPLEASVRRIVSMDQVALTTRRSILAGVVGGLAGVAAHAVGRPSAVLAEGEVIHVGDNHLTAETATYLKNSVNDADVIIAVTTGGGRGVYGTSDGGYGLMGRTAGSGRAGVHGVTGHPDADGVSGANDWANTFGALATGDKGVYGRVEESDGYAVWGTCAAGAVGGAAVHGVALAEHSTAIEGDASTAAKYAGHFRHTGDGTALRVEGRTEFTRSGVATIPAGANRVTVTPEGPVTSGTFVLATLQQSRSGIHVAAGIPNATAGTVTIKLNQRVNSATKVAWLLSETP
jgi:hypothetical protein